MFFKIKIFIKLSKLEILIKECIFKKYLTSTRKPYFKKSTRTVNAAPTRLKVARY